VSRVEELERQIKELSSNEFQADQALKDFSENPFTDL
jgi:hypothetical protein